jgi:hypothetical protein
VGGFGHRKSGRLRYTTCRGTSRQATTSNSAFSGTSGSKGSGLQRLPSALGLGPRDANWTGIGAGAAPGGGLVPQPSTALKRRRLLGARTLFSVPKL